MSNDREPEIEIRRRVIPLNIVRQWEHSGLHCLTLFHEMTGTYNGYVGVPKGHPLYGKDYHDKRIENLEVHGGVTYSDFWPELNDNNELWYIGFDTAHAGDITPEMDRLLPEHLRDNYVVPGTEIDMIQNATQFYKEGKNLHYISPFQPTYKSEGYVKKECESLAEQLSKVSKRH